VPDRRAPPSWRIAAPRRGREELDVDEAAAAVLDVQAPARLATELALHPRPHLDDLFE